jgi:tRNA(Arg) A34 adenosine deaminase TadA/predicted GIY-YIG superfamily endonuclease
MSSWLYILRCSDGSYFVGHADDLDARLAQHHEGLIPGCYTQLKRPLEPVFSEPMPSRLAAMAAELQVKRWTREKKEALIAREPAALEILAACRGEGDTSPVPPRPASPTDEHWMRQALALADRAAHADDEIPVGAVIVDADGNLLAEGANRNIAECDPTAHAEIVALRRAGAKRGNHRLPGTTLYVTLEPCAMCAMALVHARVQRVVFGAHDPKTGAAGSVFDLLGSDRHNHRVEILGGVLGAQAGQRLTEYFRRKRGLPEGS